MNLDNLGLEELEKLKSARTQMLTVLFLSDDDEPILKVKQEIVLIEEQIDTVNEALNDYDLGDIEL